MKIRKKFMTITSVVLVLEFIFIMVLVYNFLRANSLLQAAESNQYTVDVVKEAIRGLMIVGEHQNLETYLEKIRKIQNVDIWVIRSRVLEGDKGAKKGARPMDDFDRQALLSGREIDKEIATENRRFFRHASPIYVEKACLSCHTTLKEGEVMACLDMTVEMKSIFQKTVQNMIHLGTLQIIFILFIIATIFVLFGRLIMTPLAVIGGFVRNVGDGDQRIPIDMEAKARRVGSLPKEPTDLINRPDEIGELAAEFSKMRGRLETMIQKEKGFSIEKVEIEKKKADELRALNQQLTVREQELEAANQQLQADEEQLKVVNQQLLANEEELQDKMEKLEKMNKIMVGRELRIIEIKKEMNKLCKELGRPEPYPTVGVS